MWGDLYKEADRERKFYIMLLRKYMAYVMDHEGSSFIDYYPCPGCGVDFNEEELKCLKELDFDIIEKGE